MSANFQHSPEAFFPIGVMYQQYNHVGLLRPQKLDIENLEKTEHGMYASLPYYTFIKDPVTDNLYIISDGLLKAQLMLIPDSVGMRPYADGSGKFWLVAKYKIEFLRSSSGKPPKFDNAIISFNDVNCDENAGFLVSGTGDFQELPSGEDIYKGYLVRQKKKDAPQNPDIQAWDSAFKPRDHYEPLYYLNGLWNVCKLEYLDYQKQYYTKALFALPDPESRNYTIETGSMALPWGWLYDDTHYTGGESTTTMISTNKDVMNAVKRTTGYNISGSVDVSYGVVEASTSFSFKSSDSQMQKFATMGGEKTITTWSQYHHMDHAIAVNKIDLPLSQGFTEAVKALLLMQKKNTLSQQVLTDFLDAWGTHYAYAVTYGTQGSATYNLSEQQMSQMVEKGVNYSQAWQANATVKVMGSGGSIGGGSSSESDKQMQSKFANIVQESKETYICSGGASCSKDGTPSGEPNVPVFLDLRPISELLGPPFFTDPEIVFDLRDRVFEAIQAYAFIPLTGKKPQFGFVDLSFQRGNKSDKSYNVTLTWDTIDITLGPGGKLVPKANMQPSSSAPSTFTLEFEKGNPTAVFMPDGNNNTTISGSFTLAGWNIINPNGSSEGGTNQKGVERTFVPVTIKPGQTVVELVASTPIDPKYPDLLPSVTITNQPADLKNLLGID